MMFSKNDSKTSLGIPVRSFETGSRRARFALAILTLALMAGADSRAEGLKIGVFDPQRVSEATALGKQLQERVADFQVRKGREIEQKREEIAALQQKLQQQELSLSAETRSTMAKDIQRQLLTLEASQEIANRELQLERVAAMSEFEEKLLTCVEIFGRDEGFDIILERAAVVWVDKTIDVTGAIVDRFDQMFPASSDD